MECHLSLLMLWTIASKMVALSNSFRAFKHTILAHKRYSLALTTAEKNKIFAPPYSLEISGLDGPKYTFLAGKMAP